MTFEQLLLLYIYQHQKVTLQGFGTISLSSPVPDYEYLKKEKLVQVEGLSFVYDAHAATDAAFISFYADQKGKMKSLAASDIEMNILLAHQMVNLGNPYEIPGIGAIVKKQNNEVAIVAGVYMVPMIDGSARPVTLKERIIQPENNVARSLTPHQRPTFPIKAFLAIALGLLLAGMLFWLVYQFGFSNAPQSTEAATVEQVTPDTIALTNQALPIDTSASTVLNKDSASITGPLVWKAYFRKYDNLAVALSKRTVFKGAILETKDSITYRFFVRIKANIEDTARLRDSLRIFYAAPIKLVKE